MGLINYKLDDGWLSVYAGAIEQGVTVGFDQAPEWFALYLAHVVESLQHSLMVTVVDESNGKLRLGLPLVEGASGRMSARVLRSLSNYYTSLYAPLVDGERDSVRDAILCMVAALGQGALRWDEISLEPMADDSLFFQEFCMALDAHGYPRTVIPSFTNWYLVVSGRSYDQYEASLPSKLRNTLHRKQKKLERETESEIRIFRSSDGLEQALCDYESVYQKSWKGEESHPNFIRSLISNFAAKGWLRLGIMYVDFQPAAVQLWFAKDGIASIYKLAYDERYASYSVGTILTAAMMREVIDVDRVNVVDFLTGNDDYKKEWMSHQRTRYRIRVFNRNSWRGRLLALWNLSIKPRLSR